MGTPAIGPDEERLRQQASELAEEIERHIAGHQAVMGEWHYGTCTGCRTQTMLIGLPGSDLCAYCEELRVLTPVTPDLKQADVIPAPNVLLIASVIFGIAGFVTALANVPMIIPGVLLMFSLIMGKKA